MIDIVTVAHSDDYIKLADRLYWQIDAFERDFTFSDHRVLESRCHGRWAVHSSRSSDDV